MDLLRVEQELSRVRQEMQEAEEQYEKRKVKFQMELWELERQKSLLSLEIEPERVAKAKEILDMILSDFHEDPIRSAINDLAKGAPYLKTGYYGMKNYAPWRHQGHSSEYGYVPTHGTLVCAVGLKRAYRNGLTPEQTEDCIYFLNVLLDEKKRETLYPESIL